MVDARRFRLSPRSSGGRFPSDLAGVAALVALTVVAVFVPGVRESPVRLVLGLVFLLFLPGYALVSALFPEEMTRTTDQRGGTGGESTVGLVPSVELVVRLALSFGTSVAIVSLVSLLLDASSREISLVSLVVSVGAFTLACALVAAFRRSAVPPERRFSVSFRRWFAGVWREAFHRRSGVDLALNVLLVASILLAATGVGYTMSTHGDGNQYTEFYLLTENESGELVADGYPNGSGETGSLVVGVHNREHERVEYTVVVQSQRLAGDAANGTSDLTVENRTERRRFGVALEHNETARETVDISSTSGDGLRRVAFLLYRGDPPESPRIGNAYRETHVWVNATS